ncbi:MAG: prepilin-type N-terminal cleavage/methylation domain-containing protein [Bacilli bacterium]
MKKNKNGFTLIELLVTITLLAVVSVVVGVSVTGMLNRQKEKKYEDFKSQISDAACVYVEHEHITKEICDAFKVSCKINMAELINKGLIKKDLKNPSTKEDVLNDTKNYVKVSWTDGEKKCIYTEGK